MREMMEDLDRPIELLRTIISLTIAWIGVSGLYFGTISLTDTLLCYILAMIVGRRNNGS